MPYMNPAVINYPTPAETLAEVGVSTVRVTTTVTFVAYVLNDNADRDVAMSQQIGREIADAVEYRAINPEVDTAHALIVMSRPIDADTDVTVHAEVIDTAPDIATVARLADDAADEISA